MVVDTNYRLGCMKNGVDDIKTHSWFQDINWEILLQKKNYGPLNPNISKEGDTHNFYKFSDIKFQEDLDENIDYDKIFQDF